MGFVRSIDKQSVLRRFILLLIVFLAAHSSASSVSGFSRTESLERSRARIISYFLSHDLSVAHFSHKNMDDKLSEAVFSLYLKQLDGQKRFLLKEDIVSLSSYRDTLFDRSEPPKLDFADAAEGLLLKRVGKVREMVNDILSSRFDFSGNEMVETDADKLEYCRTEEELKERWRKILKYQVLYKYLTVLEDEQKSPQKGRITLEGQSVDTDAEVKAREKVRKTYEQTFKRLIEEKERDRYDRLIEAFARAFDPHTEYMPPMDKEDFDINMRGSLEGIGATLREEDGFIKIVSLVPGGPAFRQGQLNAEDIILTVAEAGVEPVDISDMRLRDAVRLIRGKKGTEVRLTVKKPNGSQIAVSITRDVVQLSDTLVKGMTIRDEQAGKTFGYLKIPSFYRDFEKARNNQAGRNVTDDVRSQLEKFRSENISGLIVDLRNNGGGALTDAVKIAGLFIKTGPVVQVKDSSGKTNVLSDDDPGISYDGPLVILVNRISASASEILAGAMQDYGRALIVGGEHTHGKGTVQTIVNLDEESLLPSLDEYKPLGALKITVQKFYRITGETTQYRGVHPDIVLPDVMDGIKSGEEYLDYALPWDTVNPVQYNKWTSVYSNLKDVKLHSLERVAANKEFAEIKDETKIAVDQRNNSLRSLNIDAAIKERAESKRIIEAGKGLFGRVNDNRKKDLTEEEIERTWSAEVKEDAYVRESIALLKDMASPREGVLVNKPHRP